jgi:hypothetical protein
MKVYSRNWKTNLGLKFLQWWLWRVSSSGIQQRHTACLKLTNVSEEYFASVFRVEEHELLTARFLLVSCLAYSSTLKMEATCSFEMSVDFQRITWRYFPELWETKRSEWGFQSHPNPTATFTHSFSDWLLHIMAAVGSQFHNILRCSLLVQGRRSITLVHIHVPNNEWRGFHRTLQLSIRIWKIQN